MRYWGPEDGHYRIANMLVDHSSITFHDGIDGSKVTVQKRVGIFGVHFADEPGKTGKISEQYGHLTPLTDNFGRSGCVRHGRQRCFRFGRYDWRAL